MDVNSRCKQDLNASDSLISVVNRCVCRCRYDYVEVEEPVGGIVLGRWCGSQMVPEPQISKGNQFLIRFVSDEYFPSDPGFCIRYTLLQQVRNYSVTLFFFV